MPADVAASPFASGPLLLLALLVFWFGGAAIMSRMAGWHVLSRRFPVPEPLQGETFAFTTAVLGTAAMPITYRRCIRMVLTREGLFMRLMFPFRFHSPPFLIPWTAFAAVAEKQVFTSRKLTFSFEGTNRQITLAGPLAQHVRQRCAEATGRDLAPPAA